MAAYDGILHGMIKDSGLCGHSVLLDSKIDSIVSMSYYMLFWLFLGVDFRLPTSNLLGSDCCGRIGQKPPPGPGWPQRPESSKL